MLTDPEKEKALRLFHTFSSNQQTLFIVSKTQPGTRGLKMKKKNLTLTLNEWTIKSGRQVYDEEMFPEMKELTILGTKN